MYALVKNGVVVTYPYTPTDLRFANPNTSFPLSISDEVLAEFGLQTVYETIPPLHTAQQYLKDITPVFNSATQRWEQVWQVVDYTAEEIAQKESSAKTANKRKAMSLLVDTDWVELPSVSDTTVTPHLANCAAFVQYRRSLREIAVNSPVTVDVWPIAPSEVWSAASS